MLRRFVGLFCIIALNNDTIWACLCSRTRGYFLRVLIVH